MASRAEEIEKAARALLVNSNRDVTGPNTKRAPWPPLWDALRTALRLPPDPPGECCRRTAEAMREAAAREVLRTAVPDRGGLATCIRALPLPGAKEGR